jgi:hypothetical protein
LVAFKNILPTKCKKISMSVWSRRDSTCK